MRVRSLTLTLLLPLILNCAKPKVVVSYIEPPRFESRTLNGKLLALASDIEARLLQVRVKGKSYFRVVSRK